MSFDKHDSEIGKASISYFHIRALRHICSSLSTEAAKTIAVAIVGSRLDYCNSLLADTSASNLARLYRWLRTSLLELLHKNFGTATSRQFWPACTGSLFAIESISKLPQLLSRYILHHQQPLYLAQILPRYTPSRSLRSCISTTISAPFRKTSIWPLQNPFHPLHPVSGISCPPMFRLP